MPCASAERTSGSGSVTTGRPRPAATSIKAGGGPNGGACCRTLAPARSRRSGLRGPRERARRGCDSLDRLSGDGYRHVPAAGHAERGLEESGHGTDRGRQRGGRGEGREPSGGPGGGGGEGRGGRSERAEERGGGREAGSRRQVEAVGDPVASRRRRSAQRLD